MDFRTLLERGHKLRIDNQGRVEVPYGRLAVGLRGIKNSTVVVQLRVLGSQLNGLIVISERTLRVALSEISVGPIREQVKAIAALEYFAVQRLCATLNDLGQCDLPISIHARFEYDTLFPIELGLTDHHGTHGSWVPQIQRSSAFHAVCKFVWWKRR